MDESNPSDPPVPARPRRDFSDAVVGLGIVIVSAGAWLFHPGAGLILLGVALVLIGTRGSIPQGG